MTSPRELLSLTGDAPQHSVDALKHDITGEREIAPSGKFDKLKDSAVEGGRRALGRDQIEIGLEEIKQVEGAEREASGSDPHEQECQPGRAVKQPIEQFEQPHGSPYFPISTAVLLPWTSLLR